MSPSLPTNSRGPIDVRYLAEALTGIERALSNAQIEPDESQRQAWEVRAAELSCTALRQLDEDTRLWEALTKQYEARLQEWQDLCVPAVGKLLDALGYQPPATGTDLKDFIRLGNHTLRTAAGLPAQDDNPFVEAQQMVKQLRHEICALKDHAANAQKRRKVLRGVRSFLLGVLVTSVIDPQVQEGLRHLGPQVAELIQTLAARIDSALTALSAGMFLVLPDKIGLLDSPGVATPEPTTTSAEGSPQGPPSTPETPQNASTVADQPDVGDQDAPSFKDIFDVLDKNNPDQHRPDQPPTPFR